MRLSTNIRIFPVWLAAFMLGAAIVSAAAQQGGLQTISNPNGGQVIYGAVPGQTTAQGAMAAALKYAHGRFNDRPRLGTIFQSRDGQSFGASFTVNAGGQASQPIAGLVMISMAMGAQPNAAILYDDQTRFAKTQSELLHKLSQVWSQQMQAAGAPGAAGPQEPIPVLHQVSGGDGSAHIGLPDGWHITAMSGGQCTAEGPNGEMVGFGLMYQQIQDPNLRSNLRFNVPGGRAGLAYPIGGNIFDAFVSITNQNLRLNHKTPATFTFVSSKPDTPMNQHEHAVEVHYIVDANNGRGPMTGSARVGENYTPGSPTWMMTVQSSAIPTALYNREWPLMLAIIHSYNQDVGVINSQLQQSLATTHAIGERTQIQVDASNSRRIASTTSFNRQMDDIDRASKIQQNYTLDRTETQDNDLRLRGAIDNNVAAALIKANPDRYQQVPNADFLKGVDY